ncbi:MAG: hypothetical protein V7739_21090 [Motiliproteus sp.]
MPDKEAIERLEALVAIDQKASQSRLELEKLRTELRTVKTELKELKALDPHRMKRNLSEQKKKMVVKNTEIKIQTKELLSLRKIIREAKSELNASQNETDAFYVSQCKRWELSYTGFQFANESDDPDSVRVRCLDRETGNSVIAKGLNDNQIAWSLDIDIPDAVAEKATETIISLKLPN